MAGGCGWVGVLPPSARTRALIGLAAAILLALPATASARSTRPEPATRTSVGASTRPGAPSSIVVGEQTLRSCASAPTGYCGHLSVPLDYHVPAGPHISIAFRWYPASAPGPAGSSGTVVPVEGGPGYGSIGSVAYSAGGAGVAGFSPMYGALLAHWNMLAIDNRGTESSAVVNCPSLQEFSGPTATTAFRLAAAGCAGSLNERWRYPGGAPVHASDLFTSALAARDMAAVVHALGLSRIDLYGDSYGSWYAQVFAARYPGLVRSLILDSTYSTAALDPWARYSIGSMPADFDLVCSRSPACASAAPGSVWGRIGEVAAMLRAKPIAATVPGPAGAIEKVSMNVVGLVDLVNDAAADKQIYAAIDAADRALLQAGDAAPLLRLYAQRLAVDELYFSVPAREYSAGLYLAVSCLDYPQLFNMRATPAARAQELSAAEAALPGATFSPFTTLEWLAQDQNTEAYSACLDWPSPTVAEAPLPHPPPLLPSTTPVLVLGGELDSWTPPIAHPAILEQLGGHSRFVEIANSTHVVGQGETVCGSTLMREFVRHPSALDALDDSCAATAPAIHAVGVYPRSLEQEPAAHAAAGNTAGTRSLRLAAAALQTAGDAVGRFQATGAALDHGLAGGTVTVSRGGSLLTLHGDQLIPGVVVSGSVNLSAASEPIDGTAVTAALSVSASGLPAATLSASWATSSSAAIAGISGSVGSEHVLATAPAP